MNADPRVRRYLGPLLTFEQAAAWALAYQDDLDRYGFGFWALEVRETGRFVGFTGLHIVDDDLPCSGVNKPGDWLGRPGEPGTPRRRLGRPPATRSAYSICRRSSR